MARKVTVTHESDTGRNLAFQDTKSGSEMTRAAFVKQIEQGSYADYHVRKINGVKTPVSNPNRSESDNLG